MSAARKKRRAKEKAVDKAIKKTVVPVAKAKAAAQMLFKMNEGRIKRYCECRVLPTIAFTMHRRFGWGAKKIGRMALKIEWFIKEYIEAGIKAKRVYITVPWLWDGLNEECKINYIPREVNQEPKDESDCRSWLDIYAKQCSINCLDYLECIWLWILHTEFGFGHKRILQAREEISKINPLEVPIKMIYHMMNIVEKLKAATEEEKIRFTTLREDLEKMDITHNGFEEGLVLAFKKQRKGI